MLDFEFLPDTAARFGHLIAYEAIGVRFRTSAGSPPRFRREETNNWISGFDPYPVGFHVVADFERPISGATSKVWGRTNFVISMIAKNAAGQVIATATSDRNPVRQTLTVTPNETISSLEWWPSASNASVDVDDIFIYAEPQLSWQLVESQFTLQWPADFLGQYRLLCSADLRDWEVLVPSCSSLGGSISIDCTNADLKFYALERIP